MFAKYVNGKISTKNRFIRSATNENCYYPGKRWQQQALLYEKLAKGGIGIIITGGFVVSSTSSQSKIVNLADESVHRGLELLPQAAHKHGAKIWMQILHAGRQDPFASEKEPAYAPSEYTGELYKQVPKVMSEEEIQGVVADFIQAAKLAESKGFDGVEILAGHGYLISQFLSPAINKREDAYGGNTSGRFRILKEILIGIKDAVTPEFTVGIKLNCHDLCEAGIKEEEFLRIGALCNGHTDFIEVSAGMNEHWKNFTGYFRLEPSFYRESARKLRKVYSGTVILVGNNIDYVLNEQMIGAGDVDLIALSRAFIREPDLIEKWEREKGKLPECLRCNQCNVNKFLGALECWQLLKTGES